MRSFSASHLLEIWEQSIGRMPLEQALVILNYAFPEIPSRKLVDLTIGQRDAYLLKIREQTFGTQLKGMTKCPACNERLELTFATNDLRIPDSLLPNPETSQSLNPGISFQLQDFDITFRLPTSADLIFLTTLEDIDTRLMRLKLLEACVISAYHAGEAAKTGDLPSEVLNTLIERMDEADPFANLTIGTTCPACNHQWNLQFDIGSYFWTEINAWAMRLMSEVHALASVYGWQEADILAMSAWRRRGYLELIGV